MCVCSQVTTCTPMVLWVSGEIKSCCTVKYSSPSLGGAVSHSGTTCMGFTLEPSTCTETTSTHSERSSRPCTGKLNIVCLLAAWRISLEKAASFCPFHFYNISPSLDLKLVMLLVGMLLNNHQGLFFFLITQGNTCHRRQYRGYSVDGVW